MAVATPVCLMPRPGHPTPVVPPEYLLSAGQAAAVLGVSRSTLNRAVESGALLPVTHTPSGHRRFSRPEVVAYRDRLLAEG